MSKPVAQIVDDLARRVSAIEPKAQRRLIAIAGPPAGGKSTLAEQLVNALGPSAALVPMDGFHVDNRLLNKRGLSARKGAPETFDALGFVQTIKRLATEPHVILPVFDRSQDLAIAGAAEVTEITETAVVEGNYLLLNEAPWNLLHPLWDFTVYVHTDEAMLTQRLVKRWQDNNHTPEQALARAKSNDLPNARRILQESAKADVTF